MPVRYFFGPNTNEAQFFKNNQQIYRDEVVPISDETGYVYTVPKTVLPVLTDVEEFKDDAKTDIQMRFDEIMGMSFK